MPANRSAWQKLMLGVYILVLDWCFAMGQGRETIIITAFAACDFELLREMGFEISDVSKKNVMSYKW